MQHPSVIMYFIDYMQLISRLRQLVILRFLIALAFKNLFLFQTFPSTSFVIQDKNCNFAEE